MPEPDQSQSPSNAENRDGTSHDIGQTAEGPAQVAEDASSDSPTSPAGGEPARNPSNPNGPSTGSRHEPSSDRSRRRLDPTAPQARRASTDLDEALSAAAASPAGKKVPTSKEASELDDLFNHQQEPESKPEASAGSSTVEGAGNPIRHVNRTTSKKSSPGDFEPSGLSNSRVMVEGGSILESEERELDFQPLEDAAMRFGMPPNDRPEEDVSSSETLPHVGTAQSRLAVHPGEQPVPEDSSGSFSPSKDRDERVPMPPADAVPDELSPVESYGIPTPSSSDRVPMWPDPTLGAGPSPMEGVGAPAPSAGNRMSVLPGPDQTDLGSPIEPYGAPTRTRKDRVAMWPDPTSDDADSPMEGVGSTTRSARDRMGLQPGQTNADGPNTIESYGEPSEDPSERVLLVPLPLIPGLGSVLEDYGVPAIESTERMGLLPFAPSGDATSMAEVYGTPSRVRGERVSLRSEPDLEAGRSAESYGHPSANPSERAPVYPQPDLDAAGNVLESYGEPSASSKQRFDVYEQPDLEAGRSIEPFGHPSLKAGQRAPVSKTPSADLLESANVLESYGTPTRRAGDRVDVYEQPDYQAGDTMESVGDPSETAASRGPVSPAPDEATLSESQTLDAYGDPTRNVADRLELVDLPDYAVGATLHGYGDPHRSSTQRMDLDPEPEIDPEFSTLKPIGKPLQNHAARINLDDQSDTLTDKSSLEKASQTSADRTSRLGRTDHDAAIDHEALAAAKLRLSTDASDRIGYINPTEPSASPLPDISTNAILEAGRMPVSQAEKDTQANVPNGLEGLMPDPRLRGHDRMRLTEEEDFELPAELLGKIPVPPRVVQVVGPLPEDKRFTAAGDERVLKKEVIHRRMDFHYQRYEELHVHRGYYHCPFAPDEPVFKNPVPRFVAGRIPLGNGLLAQLLSSIYDDHSTIFEQAGILDRLGFALAEDHIRTGLDNATLAMQPVLEAMFAEFEAGEGRPNVDKKGVDTNRPGPRNRTVEGHFLFVSRPDARLLIHLEKGETHDLIKDVPPSRRKGEVIRDLFRERVGYNRSGIWAGVRRRFTLALATSPREAAYALFLIHAINVASSSKHGQHSELVRRSRALRTWLDDQRGQFEDADNPLQRSILYTLTSWDRMRFVDDSDDGSPVAEPAAAKFPKNYVPLWPFGDDAEIRRATTWYSLIHTCRLLGVRPWEYLNDCFAALSKDSPIQPEQWTPRAWASSIRT